MEKQNKNSKNRTRIIATGAALLIAGGVVGGQELVDDNRPAPNIVEMPAPVAPIPPGVKLPKFDPNTTPAGVAGQGRGTGTSETGPTSMGYGEAGQTSDSHGFIYSEFNPNEVLGPQTSDDSSPQS